VLRKNSECTKKASIARRFVFKEREVERLRQSLVSAGTHTNVGVKCSNIGADTYAAGISICACTNGRLSISCGRSGIIVAKRAIGSGRLGSRGNSLAGIRGGGILRGRLSIGILILDRNLHYVRAFASKLGNRYGIVAILGHSANRTGGAVVATAGYGSSTSQQSKGANADKSSCKYVTHFISPW